jgi:large repetitive protein
MIDAFVILTPLLLLAVIALLGFAGCASFSSSPVPASLTLAANPIAMKVGETSTLSWSVTSAKSASIDQGIGMVYDSSNPSASLSGTVSVQPAKTTAYTLSGLDTNGTAIIPNATATITVTAPAPTVVSVSPSSGTIAGGTAITISGTNFLAGATVKLGGVAASGVTVVGATSITAVTPAHAAGAVDVTVTNPDGQAGTLNSAFTFSAGPPVVVVHLQTVSKNAGGGTTLSAALPVIPGAGKLVVVTVQWGGAGVLIVTGAPFTQIGSANLNPQQIATFYASNVSGAITVTATLSATSTTEFNLLVSAYDNVAAGSIPDRQGSTTGTGTALTLAFSTAGLTAGDLIYAVAVARSGGLVLTGSLSAGSPPPFIPEAGQGRYLLLEDYVLTAADLAAPQVNVSATNTTGTATSRWYIFAMRIKHA